MCNISFLALFYQRIIRLEKLILIKYFYYILKLYFFSMFLILIPFYFFICVLFFFSKKKIFNFLIKCHNSVDVGATVSMCYLQMCLHISGNMARRTKSVEELDKKELWEKKWRESFNGELWTLIIFSSRIGQSRIWVEWVITHACDCLWRGMSDLQAVVTFVPQIKWKTLSSFKVIRGHSNLAFDQIRCELRVKTVHRFIFI